jgi:hypothetical protein
LYYTTFIEKHKWINTYLQLHITIDCKKDKYIVILYLKFKFSNEKTAFVPRDSVIFYGISLKFMISKSSVGHYNIPRQIHRGIL